ncbi:RluA family pseudouridine synthase [Neorickettsia sennetsu]|uniref:Ribosomal large subunit pseudouridine synthase C n=1 Tax=Ehrlichia sennetsu (strain ATCC VR-367 / Miyayama) TaxID=222891 RepID=Q2GDK8_EHRS3|nr:RluA family pseudouridine synthase [Neorickettsia sennetsu]ABD46137.1 ribosomal large subunit pseudouridine synthase C [Neorickettsia sennetsu str. Miyayama]
MRSFIVENDCRRLDKYLRDTFGQFPQSALQKALRKKAVRLNNSVVKASAAVLKGDSLTLSANFLQILSSPREIPSDSSKVVDSKFVEFIASLMLYEDENVLAISKPFGFPVQSGYGITASIDNAMKSINPEYRVVHRLDKHTTGVLIFAKTLDAARELWRLFSNRLVKKSYLAIVIGELKEKKGVVDCYINKVLFKGEEVMQCNNIGNGEHAITQFHVIKKFKNTSLIELFPLTGRKHQIRSQMASIGHPVLNDGKYGRRKAFLEWSVNKKLCLHACEIEFELFGKVIKVTAELPVHFAENLAIM